jgi:hypothetical protein
MSPEDDPPPAPEDTRTPLFRWSGAYWGYRSATRVHDRYGRHVGWIEPTPSHVPRWRGRQGDAPRPSGFDVFLVDGHFLGELCDGHYVLRHAFRADPVVRAARPTVPHRSPPDPWPSREPRDDVDGWRDVLPWPLRPPVPLRA